jgi:hypothetical protein
MRADRLPRVCVRTLIDIRFIESNFVVDEGNAHLSAMGS